MLKLSASWASLSGALRNTAQKTGATTGSQTKDSAAAPESATSAESGGKESLSNLSRLLSASASRLEALNKDQLASLAKNTLDQVINGNNGDWKQPPAGEMKIIDPTDTEHLARAKQAAQFCSESVNNGGKNTVTKNPFAGLSREQLNAIAYDDSGSFTVSERRAAWLEAYNIEEAWREKVVAQGMHEYNTTGKMTKFFTDVLDHYNALPDIEKTQYPSSYAEKLGLWISMDYNFITEEAEGMGPGSLFSIMAKKLDS